MLIEFKVKNYRSFRDETILSMVASNDKELPQNVIEEPSDTFKQRLLKSAVIYGANASGKSNLIKAIEFMKKFIRTSTQGDGTTIIDVTPFAFDIECAGKPSMFEADFIHDGVRYDYGFIADKEKIHEEWLYYFPKGQQANLFERFLGEQNKPMFKFKRNYEKRLKELSENTRENSLFLTVATQFNVDFAEKVNTWFSKFLPLPSINFSFPTYTSDMVLKDKQHENKNLVIDFLKKADLEITDLEVEEETTEGDERSNKLVGDLLNTLFELGKIQERPQSEIKKIFRKIKIEFRHRIKSSKGEKFFSMELEDESDGTQRLFQLAGYFIDTINDNLEIFADELDLRLHPLLSEWLLEFFHNYKKDSRSQLIFTTHNIEFLNPKLFRRDQIWFAEKDHSSGASNLFSLSDYKPRNNENFKKNYLEGRYGAIPILRRFDYSN